LPLPHPLGGGFQLKVNPQPALKNFPRFKANIIALLRQPLS
jgi:hypothetical protein